MDSPSPFLTQGPQSAPRIALLGYGFRPFFLLAGMHAALAMPAWMVFLHGAAPPDLPLSPLVWHAHEMLYGFVLAAMAGFLLTAVPGWTKRPALRGLPLAALAVLWIAGRVAMTVPTGLDGWARAAVDLAFIPALAVAVVPSLIRARKPQNLLFLVLLAALFVANLRFHAAGAQSPAPLLLAVDTVLLLATIVGGRIVPAFTGSWLARHGDEVAVARHRAVDTLGIVAVAAVLVVDLARPGGREAGLAAAVACALLAWRLARWHGLSTWREPILLVLHVGYAWLPLALGLKALWLLGDVALGAASIHALTAGAFATLILAVMTRATLGHTGRPIAASTPVALAYALLALAALARVFGPGVAPGAWMWWLAGAGTLWTLAFAIFVIAFAPMLVLRRADGAPD